MVYKNTNLFNSLIFYHFTWVITRDYDNLTEITLDQLDEILKNQTNE